MPNKARSSLVAFELVWYILEGEKKRIKKQNELYFLLFVTRQNQPELEIRKKEAKEREKREEEREKREEAEQLKKRGSSKSIGQF